MYIYYINIIYRPLPGAQGCSADLGGLRAISFLGCQRRSFIDNDDNDIWIYIYIYMNNNKNKI